MTRQSSNESLVTVVFLLLAIAAVVIFFVWPERRLLFYSVGGVAIVIRIGQYLMRLFGNIRAKKDKRARLLKDLPPVTPGRENTPMR